jgi:hypothetical protein
MADLKKVVIELYEVDDTDFVAFQVVGKAKALYASDQLPNLVLLLKGARDVLEGSPLTARKTSYFTVVGTTHYRNALGATRQAIIIAEAF